VDSGSSGWTETHNRNFIAAAVHLELSVSIAK
jgi:hypothetical protein